MKRSVILVEGLRVDHESQLSPTLGDLRRALAKIPEEMDHTELVLDGSGIGRDVVLAFRWEAGEADPTS